MIKLYTNFPYPVEILDVVKLFFTDAAVSESADADIVLTEKELKSAFSYEASVESLRQRSSTDVDCIDELQSVRLRKRCAKLTVYNLLSQYTGKQMPWGSLTGIRPTKLARQLIKENSDWKNVFRNVLGVSDDKTELVADILQTQGSLNVFGSSCADLYVGVPFCVSRCSYCSFTSGELNRLKKYVEPYVEALCKDIRCTLDFARNQGITINNVYIGGGTPTSLTAEQLDKILSEIDFAPLEFTVEAGRPDTMTEEKLEVFKRHGVGRISINPQSFNQSVLDTVGRKHTVEDIYVKYETAKRYGFTVNMDLIAGLPGETYDMFTYSVDSAIKLNPENITVHTLALKHGSILRENNYASRETDVSKMVRYSHGELRKHGYIPYYMYRQKYMTENLENVGFCKPNTQCIYNIGIMEEISSILACGTNAISKRIFREEDRIERAANAKDVITYIDRLDDYLIKKFALFKNDR